LYTTGSEDPKMTSSQVSTSPEYFGPVKSVAAAGGIDATLDIGYQSHAWLCSITLKVKHLNTKLLEPTRDSMLWSYLPMWFFDAHLARQAIESILKNCLPKYPGTYTFDTKTTVTLVKN
jgi:hypothetical protein